MGKSDESHSYFSNYSLGLVFIVFIVIVWVAASVLTQFIYTTENFDNPFFLTYLSTSLFSIYLPSIFFKGKIKNNNNERKVSEDSLIHIHYNQQNVQQSVQQYNSPDQSENRSTNSTNSRTSSQASLLLSESDEKVMHLTLRETFYVALIIAPLWFIANFSYNASLSYTSVSSNTILSSTSSLFTFILSVLFLKEKLTLFKTLGVLIAFSGACIIGLSDRDSSGINTLLGDCLCLFSGFMYGVYTTVIKYKIPHDESVIMSQFFAFIGVINFLLLMPIVVTLHFTNVENLSNLNLTILGCLLIKGLFDNVFADYLWARAVLLTSPSVATLGLSLTVPLAMVVDTIRNHTLPSFLECLGAACVLIGFIVVTLLTSGDVESDDEGNNNNSAHQKIIDQIGQNNDYLAIS